MSLIPNEQKAHDLAVAFAVAEYERMLEERTQEEGKHFTSKPHKAYEFFRFYRSAFREFEQIIRNHPE